MENITVSEFLEKLDEANEIQSKYYGILFHTITEDTIYLEGDYNFKCRIENLIIEKKNDCWCLKDSSNNNNWIHFYLVKYI